jgi:beta-galactosidase
VAEKQLPLPLDAFPGVGTPAAPSSDLALSIADGPASLAVTGDNGLVVEVSKTTGALTGWTVGGSQLLAQPMLPCFYRAPTDNDRGGSGGNSFVSR